MKSLKDIASDLKINASVVYNFIKGIRGESKFKSEFENDYKKFISLSVDNRFSINRNEARPINEKTAQTEFDRHYIYHTAWAARILKKITPEKHTDISSSLFFSAICSTFIEMDFYDYRPANLILNNLTCGSADLMKLPFDDNSISSLSCMHTVEHIGLGRYGDTINPDGDLVAINELKRVLAKEGNLLFVVPVGKPKIIFNAHRIYSRDQILEYFNDLNLIEFTLIPESATDGGLVNAPSNDLLSRQNYGCGCFWFKK